MVDDSSPDGTGEVVKSFQEQNSRVELFSRASKQGLGRAYLEGFKQGLSKGYGRFIEMDGDFSHDPSELPVLINATDSADLVIGSRYIDEGSVAGWSRGRHLLSRVGNIYSSTLLSLPVKDSTSGFRCYCREVLEAIELDSIRSEGYAFQIEMAFRAHRAGFVIKEIPIVFKERATGKSKMSSAIVAEAIFQVTKWGLRERFSKARRATKRLKTP